MEKPIGDVEESDQVADGDAVSEMIRSVNAYRKANHVEDLSDTDEPSKSNDIDGAKSSSALSGKSKGKPVTWDNDTITKVIGYKPNSKRTVGNKTIHEKQSFLCEYTNAHGEGTSWYDCSKLEKWHDPMFHDAVLRKECGEIDVYATDELLLRRAGTAMSPAIDLEAALRPDVVFDEMPMTVNERNERDELANMPEIP